MVDNQFHTLIQAILKVATGAGLATSTDIATVVTALADLPNIEINTDAINLNVQDLEVLVAASNVLLTTIRNSQTDKSQFSKITDGTDTLLVNTDGSINTTQVSTQRTVTSSSVAVTGSVLAGKNTVSFETSSDFVGTINGVARSASRQYVFTAPLGDTLATIAYTRSAGSLIIDTL